MADGRFKPGQLAWNKKSTINKTCPKCSTVFQVKPSLDRVVCCSRSCSRSMQPSPMKGRTMSVEARSKQRAAKLGLRGENHWNWRGGSGSERHRAMAKDEYKQWRAAVFKRDDFTCQMCGERGATLHADHIRSWARYPDHRFSVTNGRTLCVPCHWTTESFPKRLIPKELRT